MSSKKATKDKEGLKNVNRSISRSMRAGVTFPVNRIRRMMLEQRDGGKVSFTAAVFMTAILEYLTAEIMDLSGEETKNSKKTRIQPRHILMGIRNDEEMNKFLHSTTFSEAGVYHNKDYNIDMSGPSQAI